MRWVSNRPAGVRVQPLVRIGSIDGDLEYLFGAGPDWVVLGQRGEMDVPTVAVYRLVEGGGL